MARCRSCSAELQPAWNYCIYCGERVTSEIPGAIRPTDGAAEAPARQVTALGLFVGGLVALLVVIGVVGVLLLAS
jgi:hypothetical protein